MQFHTISSPRRLLSPPQDTVFHQHKDPSLDTWARLGCFFPWTAAQPLSSACTCPRGQHFCVILREQGPAVLAESMTLCTGNAWTVLWMVRRRKTSNCLSAPRPRHPFHLIPPLTLMTLLISLSNPRTKARRTFPSWATYSQHKLPGTKITMTPKWPVLMGPQGSQRDQEVGKENTADRQLYPYPLSGDIRGTCLWYRAPPFSILSDREALRGLFPLEALLGSHQSL